VQQVQLESAALPGQWGQRARSVTTQITRACGARFACQIPVKLPVVCAPFMHPGFHTVTVTAGQCLLPTAVASPVLWARESLKVLERAGTRISSGSTRVDGASAKFM
jgi:hypothetical protein